MKSDGFDTFWYPGIEVINTHCTYEEKRLAEKLGEEIGLMNLCAC